MPTSRPLSKRLLQDRDNTMKATENLKPGSRGVTSVPGSTYLSSLCHPWSWDNQHHTYTPFVTVLTRVLDLGMSHLFPFLPCKLHVNVQKKTIKKCGVMEIQEFFYQNQYSSWPKVMPITSLVALQLRLITGSGYIET